MRDAFIIAENHAIEQQSKAILAGIQHRMMQSIVPGLVMVGKGSISIVAVGSGLMMASMDALALRGIGVCCAVDAGRLDEVHLIRLLEWASQVHTLVGCHVWRSRGNLETLYPLLMDMKVRNGEWVRIVYRLRGVGEESASRYIVNHDSIEAWCSKIRVLLDSRHLNLEAAAEWHID